MVKSFRLPQHSKSLTLTKQALSAKPQIVAQQELIILAKVISHQATLMALALALQIQTEIPFK